MDIKKFKELSFDDVVRMKSTDVIEYCGYDNENPRKFYQDFYKTYQFYYRDYKLKLIRDFVKENSRKMTTPQLAKICNQSEANINVIKKELGLKTYDEKARPISDVLDRSFDDIKQTVLDLYPAEYIKIKIKKKIKKPSKLKIKMKRMAKYWKFTVLSGRRKVAEGEYHKNMPYNAIKEIEESYLGIVK